MCQICGKPRHTVIDCYQRMNQAYEGGILTQQLCAMAAIAQTTPPFNNAYTTWVTNTDASNNLTVDLANLAIHDDYHKTTQVAIGNGVGLKITHVGSSNIFYNSSTFKPNHILHCPKQMDYNSSENGLHPLTIHNQIFNKIGRPFAFIGVRVPMQTWHSRLGHLASNTDLLLITNKSLPIK